MKKRLDLQMVDQGLAPSRTRAQDLIKSGSVTVDGRLANSSSLQIDETAQIEILQSELTRYVSRGGLKLEGALRQVGFMVEGINALDVGISTGGFTDCLLQKGAKHVIGIDVGHAQLHPSLRSEARLTCIEGVNARDLDRNLHVLSNKPASGWDLVVVDVSFISLTLVLPAIQKVLSPQGRILALVKPQFEVGPEGLGKGGLVKNPSLYQEVEDKIRQFCSSHLLDVLGYFDSPIEGKDGNREFFVYLRIHE
jgi:23S rRNA (cytidine1920-2'-O)/16S rRNA (cytidine1409-2'-O)-methyltransferase